MSHRHAHHSDWQGQDENPSPHEGWHPAWLDMDSGRTQPVHVRSDWDAPHEDGFRPAHSMGGGSWNHDGCGGEGGCHEDGDHSAPAHGGGDPSAGWPGFDDGHHFDAVLFGHLAGAEGPGAPLVVIPIEHLEVNNNTLIQNHSEANTNVLVNAGDGGHVGIGGSVLALGTSDSVIVDHAVTGPQAGGSGDLLHELGLDRAGDFDQLFAAAHGGCGHGGAPIVVIPIDHLTVNNNTLIQNTQVENTNVVLDAHGGGSINVGGDVSAHSTQHSYIEHA
jgi:hypothetical protein